MFVPDRTPLAIGNETDMFHPLNQEYLVELLRLMEMSGLRNPVSLITKAPVAEDILARISSMRNLRISFFLSYSGLPQEFEPNFNDSDFRGNFQHVKKFQFPIVHYWRPLIPENSSLQQIRNMLSFVSSIADASVIVGLKLHPELTDILRKDSPLNIPVPLLRVHGEWLPPKVVRTIYSEAESLCPNYPIYRHTSCALATVLSQPNHTATVYRRDICPPSHCPKDQRKICENSKGIPNATTIADALSKIGKSSNFQRLSQLVSIDEIVSQEQFSYLLHALNCPVKVKGIRFENLYRGDIYVGQRPANKLPSNHSKRRDNNALIGIGRSLTAPPSHTT
jgi:hypothetical protein